MGSSKSLKGYIQKWNDMPNTVKTGLWFTICGFLQKGISMITTPFFSRVLSKHEFGVVNTFNAWQVVINLLITLTLYRSMMNLYVKHENKERTLSQVLGLSFTITGFWLAIAIIFINPLSVVINLPKPLIIGMFIYSIGESVVQCWMIYKRYIYDYKAAVFVTIMLSIVSGFGGLLCVWLIRKNAIMRWYPQIIIYFIVGVIIAISIFSKQKAFYNKQVWIFAATFCIGLMPHYLSEFVLQSSDKLMIDRMCGTEDVAMYSQAYNVGSLISIFANAINSSFVPYQYQKIQSKEFKQLAKSANAVQFLLAIILMLLMLFSTEVVLIFGGKSFLPCTNVIIPICLGVYFNYMFQLFARVQEYYNKKLTVVIPSILCAALNIVLNLIYIRMYGYKAASYTTFACFVIFCLIHYVFYRNTCKKMNDGVLLYDGKTLLLISLGITGIGVIAYILQEHIIIKYAIGVIVMIMIVIFRKKLIDILKTLSKK